MSHYLHLYLHWIIYFVILQPFFHKTLFSFYVSLLKTLLFHNLSFTIFCSQKLYLKCLIIKALDTKRYSICLCYPKCDGNRSQPWSKTSNVTKSLHQHQNKRKSRVKTVAKALLTIRNFKCCSKSPFLYKKMFFK